MTCSDCKISTKYNEQQIKIIQRLIIVQNVEDGENIALKLKIK